MSLFPRESMATYAYSYLTDRTSASTCDLALFNRSVSTADISQAYLAFLALFIPFTAKRHDKLNWIDLSYYSYMARITSSDLYSENDIQSGDITCVE